MRLENILQQLTDGTHSTPKYTQIGIPFLSVKNMSNGKLSFSNTKYISENEHIELSKRCKPEKGDILLSKVGTTGIPVLIDTDKEFSIFVSLALLKLFPNTINPNYLVYLIQSPFIQIQAKENTRGVGNKNWVLASINKTIIPLPPLNEQHKIAAKIEELLPFIEQYDKQEQALKTLNKNFPEQLKKSILQAAIQGKLTEQLPTDEPASELLKRIEAEKVRLISEGKLKKPRLRDNSQNAKFEPPFEIPTGWEWVKLGEIIEILSGVTYSKADQITQINNGTRIIRGGNIINDELKIFDNDVIIKNGKAKENQFLKIGDLITPSVTSLENVGKFALVKETIESSAIGGFVFCLRTFISNNIFNNYLFCLLRSEFVKKQMQERTNKSGQAFYNLGKTKFEEILLPIPSYEEQKRIVEKVELLLSQIERL